MWGSVGLAACFSVEKGIRATELAGTVFGGVKTEVEEEADGDTVSNPGDSACGFGATEEEVEDAPPSLEEEAATVSTDVESIANGASSPTFGLAMRHVCCSIRVALATDSQPQNLHLTAFGDLSGLSEVTMKLSYTGFLGLLILRDNKNKGL